MRRIRSQSGFTLIELMIAIGILGLLSALISRLVTAGIGSWQNGLAQVQVQQEVRLAREYIEKNLRLASTASVLVSRTGTAQPLYSMVSFTDVDGQQHQVFQNNGDLIADVWPNTWTAHRRITLIKNDLQSFHVYFPNTKNFTAINVSVLAERNTRFLKRPAQMLMTASVQLRNP
jgi:prepilin-type N-terminal cleavage/methylation domain-containing protein